MTDKRPNPEDRPNDIMMEVKPVEEKKEKRFKCEACGQTFDTKEELDRHAREHHGKK
mgnify:CR=1 FL=1